MPNCYITSSCPSFASAGLLIIMLSQSDFFENTTQNVFTVSPRASPSLRSAVLLCRYCICSVEIMFIVMFMHKRQPFYCHRAFVSECTDFNFVADNLTQSETVNVSQFSALMSDRYSEKFAAIARIDQSG